MMPEVSIYYLMAIFRVFLLIIGQSQSFSVIASTKNDIDMKCLDSLKPLCEDLVPFVSVSAVGITGVNICLSKSKPFQQLPKTLPNKIFKK